MIDFKKAKRKLAESQIGDNLTQLSSALLYDLTVPRSWEILSYNEITEDYIIKSTDGQQMIISCLKCETKLEIGKEYWGYKNAPTRTLVLVNT